MGTHRKKPGRWRPLVVNLAAVALLWGGTATFFAVHHPVGHPPSHATAVTLNGVPSAIPPAKVLPPVSARTYIVRQGDSLWLIGQQYCGGDWTFLATANKIQSPYLLNLGEVIKLDC